MMVQTVKVVDLCGSAGKGEAIDPPSSKITAGASDFNAASPREAPGKWCRTTTIGAELGVATRHPFSSGDSSYFVVGCQDGQEEAAEPLLGEVPSTGGCASEIGDGHLTLEEEHKVSVKVMNWVDATDICFSDEKSSSKGTLDQTQPPVELCPLGDPRSCDATSQVVDESTLSDVLCPHRESGEPSVNQCLALAQGATYVSMCQSMEKSSPSSVLHVPQVCHGLEEKTSFRMLCSPVEQGVPPAVLCQPMREKASFSALVLPLCSGTNATLLHACAEAEPFAVPCPTLQQTTQATLLDPSLEARVPIGDQCHYPEQHRLSDGISSPLHHREACLETDTFVAECMEVSPDQQSAEALVLSVEDEVEHQECPICTEQYDTGQCRQAQLNCQHVVCDNCVKAIMDQGGQADIGRVKCPICRQKTPMMKWEILKLQESMLEQDCTRLQTVQTPLTVVPRRPGLCGALEYNFQQRFRTSRTFSCIPCLRYPLCFIERLNELERRNRCCYLFTLVLLYFAEKLCFVLPFLPILMLVLIITLDTHT
ncbi:hypothetical protein NDU88_011733 [Pleurodeles waltl]|uniref:E3 ubiquitin-protein ligase RNF182 n=1 Tax=Pleurodeles waltl TaxID=8319 RepID=A0AAV7R0V4_PLEWA|nr:hypothetical protein NDU88_011733 [Pleurodeles waltl]